MKVLTKEQLVELYIKPAANELWRKVESGEPLTGPEVALIHSLGPESESWALNIVAKP